MRYSAIPGSSTAPQPAPRTGVRAGLFYGMFALLFAGNALSLMALLLAPDIAKLLNGQNDQVIAAYENRIAQLRVEVDRLHSRSYAQAGDINLQLQELSQQQEVLTEQHQLVKVLVDKAGQLGIDTAALPGPANGLAFGQSATVSGNADIDTTAAALARMMDETQYAMTAISDTATARTGSIVAELSGLGISAPLPDAVLGGMGGPLLPAATGEEISPMVEDANAVLAALVRYQAARDSLDRAPIHMPIAGNFRRSSTFGNRRDPFTGRTAFHAGYDFAAPTGTTVLSAGEGVVSFTGTKAGYGNVVEVTHANGLLSRYAHLSGFLSKTGQRVGTGTPIAKVGSTGRSTGPHLHFEVRRADRAMDPSKFLDAGKRLLALLR